MSKHIPMRRLRPPGQVARLSRLGSFHQTRLSFMRVLLRALAGDDWQFDRPIWEVDGNGVGVAVYRMRGPNRTYSLVCFAHDLDPALRSDRVIATAWDATFALYDGEPDAGELERLGANVPLQEAGRFRETELVLSRVNRSVRLFEHVVSTLASGRQPDVKTLRSVGYLMRTTAVYGNGKFGIADRARFVKRPELAGPFRAEMLTVWLIRAFTVDLANHIAALRSAGAVALDVGLRRGLGVGNATGLGLGPFLINHPALFSRWLEARETALARVRAIPEMHSDQMVAFRSLVMRARIGIEEWRVMDEEQAARIRVLEADLRVLSQLLEHAVALTWDDIYRWGEQTLSTEGCELLVSLLIEPHGDLVDDLADEMSVDETTPFAIDGAVSIAAFRRCIATHYGWALSIDFASAAAQARFWYVSEEKLEPRLGERYEEAGAERELPIGVARGVRALDDALADRDPEESLYEFLISCPEHRHTVRRVQLAAVHPYSEIHDNLLDAKMKPLDLLRCKLSFFGATKFDPKSDRWLRINMFENAPFPDELVIENADDWAFPGR